MPPDVVLYTTPLCFYCVRAKQLFTKKGVPFREVDVRAQPEARRWLHRETGKTSVPMIFINGALVGGYYELASLERAGELDALLRESRPASEL